MSYAFVQIDAVSLKQYHATRSITAENGQRIYEIVFYARRYFARESNKTSDMRFQAEKFNNDLQLLKNGGEYLYGDEDVTLEPAQGKYADKIAEVEETWERFYDNIRIIDTKKLMKENPNAGELFSDDAGLRVPNPEVIDALNQMENSTTEFDDLNKELLLLYTEGLNDEQDNFKLTLLFLRDSEFDCSRNWVYNYCQKYGYATQANCQRGRFGFRRAFSEKYQPPFER